MAFQWRIIRDINENGKIRKENSEKSCLETRVYTQRVSIYLFEWNLSLLGGNENTGWLGFSEPGDSLHLLVKLDGIFRSIITNRTIS